MTHWIAAAVSVVLLVAGFVVDPRAALAAYLAAFAFAMSTGLGALTLAMIGRITEARWYLDGARRPVESLVATVPLLGLFFVPIGFGLSLVYPWAWYEDAARGAWLSPRFFLLRSAFYVASWGLLALIVPRSTRRASIVGLPLVALTATFASFDWFLSLEPEFNSAIYGLYVWSGGFQAALALAVLLGARGEAMGKLLLTASIFWAYMAYSQGVIVWLAGIPRETAWYAARTEGAWRWVLGALLVAKFVVPFFTLLPYEWKRRRSLLAVACASTLAGHVLDMEWLIAPAIHAAPALRWLDAVALVALSSFLLGAARSEREAVPA